MSEAENRLPLGVQHTVVNHRTTPELLASCSTREARELIDQKTARLLEVLPLGIFDLRGSRTLSVAVSQQAPLHEIYTSLRFSTALEIHLVSVEPECLQDAFALCYSGDDQKLLEATDRIIHLELQEPEDLVVPPTTDSEIPNFFQALLEYAVAHHCSDLHIVPKQRTCLIRLRKNGEIRSHQIRTYDSAIHKRLLNRVKIIAGIDSLKKHCALEGSIPFTLNKREYTLRVSILPTIYGEKVVIRLPQKGTVRALSELGLDQFSNDALDYALNKREGIILLCGPTGGGKTTTLYSCLDRLHKHNLNIVTVEDPVELELEYASQTSLSELHDMGYDQVLKALLRHDPDVIMLGEIRDQQTARAAFEAAVTGHLVLSTVHASGATQALLRLNQLGVSSLVLSQVLNLIIFQRLLPKLCEQCKIIDLQSSTRPDYEIYKAAGCPACSHTGYSGVHPVEETLYIDSCLRFILADNQNSISTRELAAALCPANFLSFKESMKRKLLEGILDIESCRAFW